MVALGVNSSGLRFLTLCRFLRVYVGDEVPLNGQRFRGGYLYSFRAGFQSRSNASSSLGMMSFHYRVRLLVRVYLYRFHFRFFVTTLPTRWGFFREVFLYVGVKDYCSFVGLLLPLYYWRIRQRFSVSTSIVSSQGGVYIGVGQRFFSLLFVVVLWLCLQRGCFAPCPNLLAMNLPTGVNRFSHFSIYGHAGARILGTPVFCI